MNILLPMWTAVAGLLPGCCRPETQEGRAAGTNLHAVAMQQALAQAAPARRTGRPDLRVDNSIHDRHKMESSFHFNLRPLGQEPARHYRVDLYTYIPSSIGINSHTYARETFYRHLTSYFRIRTPDFPEWHVGDPADFRIASAEEYLQVHLPSSRRRELGDRVAQDARLFACFVNTRLKRLVEEGKALARQPGGGRRAHWALLERRVEIMASLRLEFRRRYLQRLQELPILADEEVRRAFLLCDEFLSFRVESLLMKLAAAARKAPASHVGEVVRGLLAPEADYRRERGMPALERSERARRALESYTYRLGMLKKFVSEVLYLGVEPINREKMYRNGIAAFAAALAATFAALAEQQRLQLMVQGGSSARVAILLALAVVAYVFKDRIKDLSKEYFFERLKTRLSDFQLNLSYRYVSDAGRQVEVPLGHAEEFMRWLRPETVPEEVEYVRSVFKRAEVDPVPNETVLHYSRRFALNATDAEPGPGDLHSIKNVLRFDFSEFLTRLDDRTKKVEFFDRERGPTRAGAHKVYHVNLVFRYESEALAEDGTLLRLVELERLRVILDKGGLVRLETVIPRGQLGYRMAPGE